MHRQARGLGSSIWAKPSPSRRRSFSGLDGNNTNWSTTTKPITPSLAPNPPPAPRAQSASRTNTPPATSTSPATGPPQASSTTAQSASQELTRYTKIVRRLKWKFPYLAMGYNQATAGDVPPDDRAEAELMFKLDFYEYYMLLERALVHLLGVFNVTISRGSITSKYHDEGAGNGSANSAGNDAEQRWGSTHRYHHNVLAALDRPDNPLYEVLGTGEVRSSLARAKDLRNRWKYAEEEERREQEAGKGEAGGEARRGGGGNVRRVPLEIYDLEGMLRSIFDGFDAGYGVAEARVAQLVSEAGGLGEADGMGGIEQWDFMVDAMDWEAV